jgi:hypothetical protein
MSNFGLVTNMPEIQSCDECGHDQFVHPYETQICAISGCGCNGWKEEPSTKRMMEEVSQSLARMLTLGFS